MYHWISCSEALGSVYTEYQGLHTKVQERATPDKNADICSAGISTLSNDNNKRMGMRLCGHPGLSLIIYIILYGCLLFIINVIVVYIMCDYKTILSSIVLLMDI